MRGLHTHTPILILYFHTHSDKQRHTHDLNPSDMPVLYSLALYYSHLPWEDHWRFKLSCYHAYSIPSLSLSLSVDLSFSCLVPRRQLKWHEEEIKFYVSLSKREHGELTDLLAHELHIEAGNILGQTRILSSHSYVSSFQSLSVHCF